MDLLECARETLRNCVGTLSANHTGDECSRSRFDVHRVLADCERRERPAFARPKRIAHEILNRREHSRNQIGVRDLQVGRGHVRE